MENILEDISIIATLMIGVGYLVNYRETKEKGKLWVGIAAMTAFLLSCVIYNNNYTAESVTEFYILNFLILLKYLALALEVGKKSAFLSFGCLFTFFLHGAEIWIAGKLMGDTLPSDYLALEDALKVLDAFQIAGMWIVLKAVITDLQNTKKVGKTI